MLEPHDGGSDGLFLPGSLARGEIAEQRVSLLQELAGPKGAWEELFM